MQTFEALLCAILGGMFGGSAFFARGVNFANDRFVHDGYPMRLWQGAVLLVCNGVIGVSGAAVGLLLLLLVQKFPSEDTTESLILLASVAVVGGYGGRRFLPMVVLNVEDALQRFQREAARQSEQLEHRLSEKIETNEVLAKITRYAFSDFREDGLDASYIKLCEGIIKDAPDSAHAYVALARLYRRKDDLPKSIQILTDYLHSNPEPTPPDAAWNTIFYNLACYHSLVYQRTGNPNILAAAIEHLARSQFFSRDIEADREFARSEKDFDGIRASAEFARLVDPSLR